MCSVFICLGCFEVFPFAILNFQAFKELGFKGDKSKHLSLFPLFLIPIWAMLPDNYSVAKPSFSLSCKYMTREYLNHLNPLIATQSVRGGEGVG